MTDVHLPVYYAAMTHEEVLKDESYQFFYSGKKPVWAKNMKCKQIGKQTFCKEKKNDKQERIA